LQLWVALGIQKGHDNDDDDDDDDAGGATVHCVLRNAASHCPLEAKTWSVTIFLHA